MCSATRTIFYSLIATAGQEVSSDPEFWLHTLTSFYLLLWCRTTPTVSIYTALNFRCIQTVQDVRNSTEHSQSAWCDHVRFTAPTLSGCVPLGINRAGALKWRLKWSTGKDLQKVDPPQSAWEGTFLITFWKCESCLSGLVRTVRTCHFSLASLLLTALNKVFLFHYYYGGALHWIQQPNKRNLSHNWHRCFQYKMCPTKSRGAMMNPSDRKRVRNSSDVIEAFSKQNNFI